jgi:hypothetical protein
MSVRELRARMALVKESTPPMHLCKLPEHQSTLRLTDVARYIGHARESVYRYSIEGRDMPAHLQRDLSRFFWLWDQGRVAKECVDGVWQLVSRSKALAPLAAAPGAQGMRIELTAQGPRLRRA